MNTKECGELDLMVVEIFGNVSTLLLEMACCSRMYYSWIRVFPDEDAHERMFNFWSESGSPEICFPSERWNYDQVMAYMKNNFGKGPRNKHEENGYICDGCGRGKELK
jgi:hypothetical protein